MHRWNVTVRVSGVGFDPVHLTESVTAASLDALMDDDVLESSDLARQLEKLKGKIDEDQIEHLSFEVRKGERIQRRVPKKRRA